MRQKWGRILLKSPRLQTYGKISCGNAIGGPVDISGLFGGGVKEASRPCSGLEHHLMSECGATPRDTFPLTPAIKIPAQAIAPRI